MSLLSNAKWNFFSQFFKVLIQLVNLIYLAKILPPSEYGLMAMASVVVSLGILLRDLGTTASLIQRKILTEELKNTVFWINLIMGFIIAIIICMSSVLISKIYAQPKLVSVFVYMSVIFPLSSCAATHLALMERESRFRAISIIETFSAFFSVIVAIIMAKSGFGVFSLVGQAISLNLISATQFWFVNKWRPSLKIFINPAELKKIFGFSSNLSLFNLIHYFSLNGDSFIIGKYMTPAILGSYNLAYRIMLFPLQSLTFVMSRSLYPILSEKQDKNDEILVVYNNCVFFVLMVAAPLMSGVALLSEPFIHILLGDKWYLTADILKWLAPTAIIQSVLSSSGAVFTAKGRTDLLMRLGILGTILQFGSFLIGVHFGIIFFAFLYFVANLINFFPVMWCLFNLLSGSLFSFFRNVFPIFLSTGLMIFSLIILNFYFYDFSKVDSYLSLILVSVFGFFVYCFSLFFISKKVRSFVINYRKGY